jgi:hypothetical protein
MPREQNERRPSKPDLPRVEAGDAERLSTRFNAIHTRWQGESPSKPPSIPGAAARHEPLPDHTSVLVSPILKIDNATPPMPSGLNLAHGIEPHAGLAEPEPWEHEDSPAPVAAASAAALPELDDEWSTSAAPPAKLDEGAAASDEGHALAEQGALANAEYAAGAPAQLARAGAAEPPPSADDIGTRDDDERPSPTPPLRDRSERASVPAKFGTRVEHELEPDEPELARLKPPSRWRWLLAALTIAVAGVSLYRTLYVGKQPSADTAASALPAAAPPRAEVPPARAPAPPQATPSPASPASAALVAEAPAAPATSVKAPAAARLDADAPKAKPSPAPAAVAKGKPPARKATAPAAKAASGKVSAGATKQSVKETAPGRRKLSAKPRKPPQKKERTGIIRKSPF